MLRTMLGTLLFGVVALGLVAGCASAKVTSRQPYEGERIAGQYAEPSTPATAEEADNIPAPPPAVVATSETTPDPSPSDPASDVVKEDYDPWENFNQKMFTFNRQVDKYVLKPAAKAYDVVMPEPWQKLIDRGMNNLRFPARFVNNLLQRKWGGAGREVARFLINSTAGIGGLFDPAGEYWGIEPSNADFGQTLGKWGLGPGPYLVLPLLPPLTLRDGLGLGVDTATNPLAYYTPFVWDGLGLKAGDTVNDRAINIDRFQGFEESVLDMYSAVRDAYLRRREQRVRE